MPIKVYAEANPDSVSQNQFQQHYGTAFVSLYQLNFTHLANDCKLGDQLNAALPKMKAVDH